MAQRAKQDINIYQGDTRSYKFTFFTDAAQQVEWDFSSAASVLLSVKETLDSSAVLFSISASNSLNGNDWANGIAVFEIPSTESVKLTANAKFDVQIKIGTKYITPVFGDAIVQKQITPST